ncbi:MAG: hypothetical protein FJW31_22940 [Acidobacteria bacterium]|nr:hypothetical protein [Acidobacteriota bacterium]
MGAKLVENARQSMTLGEERFHQILWQDGEPESDRSKTFSMGYDRLARLIGLDEKSVRQLIPRLVAKRILEVVAPEDCSARQGRTYRIFASEEILDRQRRAGLTHVIKRGRAVEFVAAAGGKN